MDGVHDRLARAAATGALRRAGAPGDGARPALRRVRAACRLCGFSVHGFLNGMTCVLQVDGRALRDACREAGAPKSARHRAHIREPDQDGGKRDTGASRQEERESARSGRDQETQ